MLMSGDFRQAMISFKLHHYFFQERTMYYKSAVIMATLVFTLVLSGCQQHASIDPATVQKQNEQLASLVAAGNYLRQQCAENTIPDNEMLLKRAEAEGASRGWDIGALRMDAINKEAALRYHALESDNTQREDKCSALKRSAARFIYPK